MSIKLISKIFDTQFDKPLLKFVLIAMADNATDDGHCWPSIPTIAQKCSVTERYVYIALNELEASGRLKREQRFYPDGRNRSSEYWITLDQHVVELSSTTLNSIQGDPEQHSGGTLNSVHPSKENRHIEPSYETNTAHALKSAYATCADKENLFEEFWKEYPTTNGKKPDKARAQIKFKEKVKTKEMFDEIIIKLKQQKLYKLQAHKMGLFEEEFSYAKTWLHNERWNDELVDLQERKIEAEKKKAATKQNQAHIGWCEIRPCGLSAIENYRGRALCVTHAQECKRIDSRRGN